MSAKFKYVDDARKFGKMLEGFIQLANEVESVAAIEQQAKEIESRISSLKAEEEKAKSSMDKAKADLYAIQVNAESVEKSAKERSDSIIMDAQVKASIELSAAKESAQKIIMEANGNAQSLMAECDAMSEKSKALDSEIKDKEKKVSELNEKLAAIKASLGV